MMKFLHSLQTKAAISPFAIGACLGLTILLFTPLSVWLASQVRQSVQPRSAQAANVAQEEFEPIYVPFIASRADSQAPCRLSDKNSVAEQRRCEHEFDQRMGSFNPPEVDAVRKPLFPAVVMSAPQITELVKLVASDGEGGDRFGKSVAISGDTVIVGAELWDNGANLYQGAAYIFDRNHGGANNWGEVAQLIASDGQHGDACGYDVAIDGDIAVILCPYHDVNGNANQGAVYIFERNHGGANNWGESAILYASDGGAQDVLGAAVIIQDDRIVIGADWVDIAGNLDQGAVYVFEKDSSSATGWTEVAKLVASDGQAEDLFGWDIAMHGDRIISGAPRVDINGKVDQGAMYVYEFNTIVPNQWAEVQKLVANDGMAGDQFGWATAMDDHKLMAGARLATANGNAYQGATYTYTFDGGSASWQQKLKLAASDGQYGDQLGQSVIKNGNLTLAGAYLGDAAGGYNQGSVYLFSDGLDSIWANTFVSKLVASDAAINDHFGWATALSGSYAVTGAYKAVISGQTDQGAAYVHDVSSYIDSTPAITSQTSPVGSTMEQTPNFTWQAQNNATSYDVVIFDVNASAIVHQSNHVAINVCDTATLVCTVQLPANSTLAPGDYTWLIRAINSIGLGPWSIY